MLMTELLTQIELNLKPEDWRKRKRGPSVVGDEGEGGEGDVEGDIEDAMLVETAAAVEAVVNAV